jgi:HrpA-like RNA helicase
LNETLESLKTQGVIDPRNEKVLTPLGIIMAKLPVDVAVSKVCLPILTVDTSDS